MTSVEPSSPLSGLHPQGQTTSGGSCQRPGTAAVGGLLFVGQKQLFTMRFQLPKTCPQPLPVAAAVGLRVGRMQGTTSVPVFVDLGAVRFASCPV